MASIEPIRLVWPSTEEPVVSARNIPLNCSGESGISRAVVMGRKADEYGEDINMRLSWPAPIHRLYSFCRAQPLRCRSTGSTRYSGRPDTDGNCGDRYFAVYFRKPTLDQATERRTRRCQEKPGARTPQQNSRNRELLT